MANTDLIAGLITLALAIPAVGWLITDARLHADQGDDTDLF